jgi:hypothetical protein
LLRHHFLHNLFLNFYQVQIVNLVLKQEDCSSISKAEVFHLDSIVIVAQETKLGSNWAKLELRADDAPKLHVAKLLLKLVVQNHS